MTNCRANSRACYGLMALGLLTWHAGSTSWAADIQIHPPNLAQSKIQNQTEGAQILQFSGEYASAKLAIFPATSSMQAGQLFKTARKAASHASTWIPTGMIKIVEVRDQLAFAPSRRDRNRSFPHYVSEVSRTHGRGQTHGI